MDNYIAQVRKQIDENNAIIVIDNSDITKPCSPMTEAISDAHDGSTVEIKKGYYTVETAVLSKRIYFEKRAISTAHIGSLLWNRGFRVI